MKNAFVRAGALLVCLWPLAAVSQVDPDDLLPVEDAFALEAGAEDGALVLRWEIAEGYYLYRHAFGVDSTQAGVELGEPDIPQGEAIVDEFFGETETYRDAVTIRVPVETVPPDGLVKARVAFQGCADLGVCYPPHRQEVSVRLPAPPSLPQGGGQSSLSRGDGGSGSALNALLGAQRQALPAEQAFRIEAIADGPDALLVRATAQPDYYLYRESFSFLIADPDIEVISSELPPGEPKTDEYFGDTRVYFGEVEIPLRLARPAGDEREIELETNFQGCLDEGICYPPMTRSIAVTLPPADTASDTALTRGRPAETGAGPAEVTEDTVEAVLPQSEQDRLAAALTGRPLVAMGLFLLAGVLLAFTPCVFPMVPILSGLIAGEGDRMTTGRAFRLSLVYVLAMALVYTMFGIVAGVFGQNLQAVFQHPVVLVSFAVLFVALSMAMFGFYELQLPSGLQTRLNEMSNRAEGGTLIGAAVMGALSALIVGPCVAPALMGALIYIGQTGDAVLGGLALFAMAIGMGIPLIIWGTSAGKLLPRAGGWMNAVKAVFGVGLLALAVWMLERVLPGAVIMLLWGALAIGSGVYLGALTRLAPEESGWRKLWQALGVMLLVVGIAQFVGALSGGRDWTRPMHHLVGAGGAAGSPALEAPAFRKVETLEQLQAAIAASDRPVFLDFYADWCVDCVRMDRRTFPDPAVAEKLAGFTLLKADITAYNDEHKAMLQHFDLIGPPAYLFFADGEELKQYRMFGFLGPDEFLPLLDEVAR